MALRDSRAQMRLSVEHILRQPYTSRGQERYIVRCAKPQKQTIRASQKKGHRSKCLTAEARHERVQKDRFRSSYGE